MSVASLDQARAAKSGAKRRLARHGRIVGIGLTRVGEGFGLKVNFATAPRASESLPDSIDGVPVQVEVVGPVRKRAR